MNAPLPPPPAIICPAQAPAPTNQPLTRAQGYSIAQVLAAVQAGRSPTGLPRGRHFGERQRVAIFRSRGGGRRR